MLCYRVVDKEFQEGFTPYSPVTKDAGKCWDVTIKSWWFEESHPKRMDLGQISTHTHSLLGVDQWTNLNSWCVTETNGFTRLMSSKANLLTLGWQWGKYRAWLAGPSRENGQLMFKKPELPDGLQKRVFKGKVREMIARCVISLWTSFLLVGGEVTGWCFRDLNYQPLIPTSSGSMCWWSACS